MKELSIEQKAKAYDELFIKAKQIYNKENDVLIMHTIEDLFPEVKEPDGEKIRKALIEHFKFNVQQILYDFSNKDVLAWLERQGEQIDIANKEYWRGYREGKKEILDKYAEQSEQKPADTVKPKFKVGDWVMLDRPVLITKVKDMPYNTHQYWTSDGTWFGDVTKSKLWTIQDAKNGDVLATEDNCICIFDNTVEEGKYPFAYCGLSMYGFKVCDRTLPFTHDNVYPATKEQRDLLFQKMNEAGYTFDFENKKLKKIEQKPEENKGNIGGISPNWSDDDERMLDYVIGDILSADTLIGGKETASYKCDWLKSLKGRVQHQQEWSKEDEACVILLDSICESSEAEYYDHPDSIIRKEIVNARNWLKYLKGRVKPQWKPSVEQMDTLWFYAEQNNYDGAVLTLLYNDLKKLKEE